VPHTNRMPFFVINITNRMPFFVWGTKKTRQRLPVSKFQRSGLGPGWAAGVCAGPADVSGTRPTRQRGARSPGTRPEATTVAKTRKSTPATSRGPLGAYRSATTRLARGRTAKIDYSSENLEVYDGNVGLGVNVEHDMNKTFVGQIFRAGCLGGEPPGGPQYGWPSSGAGGGPGRAS
jgi:hypothetical protein